jgi:hypothetical protein
MNPLHPRHLKPLERRAQLCRILARGLVRLKMRDAAEASAAAGEFPLHNSADQSAHANREERRTA